MSALAPEVSPIDTNTMTVESAATSTEALRVQWKERIGQAQEGAAAVRGDDPLRSRVRGRPALARLQHAAAADGPHQRGRSALRRP
jgi:hypothetical protein